ncbi:hypothetical protein GCM10010520_27860 [Rhizobium viscosum]|uniref:Uncharacterized protein n=1 Tax=Rhizobium viscosum TaxID=1673 RepID=A0ABR9J0K6_RHIVS|nr:hypothetical protein [Rhizobium viscosum]MBE1508885.1 hypothetical protein [Rhizobium viscosum]
MIRFAPKIEQDAAPAIKVAKSNAKIRLDVELSDIPTAAVENETYKMEGQATTTISGPAGPAAKPLELSGELPAKGRKTGSRKRKEVTGPKQHEISNRGRDQIVGDLLLDL